MIASSVDAFEQLLVRLESDYEKDREAEIAETAALMQQREQEKRQLLRRVFLNRPGSRRLYRSSGYATAFGQGVPRRDYYLVIKSAFDFLGNMSSFPTKAGTGSR